MAHNGEQKPTPHTDTDRPDMNPGDEAPPGTAGTGEDICPVCEGSGSVDGAVCDNCGGSGKIIEGVGGA